METKENRGPRERSWKIRMDREKKGERGEEDQ